MKLWRASPKKTGLQLTLLLALLVSVAMPSSLCAQPPSEPSAVVPQVKSDEPAREEQQSPVKKKKKSVKKGGAFVFPSEQIPKTPNEAKQLRAGLIGSAGPSPDMPYESYTLFLIPDPHWEQTNSQSLGSLNRVFLDFSVKIGDRNFAVWFAREDAMADVTRMRSFCRRFALSAADGPYLVTMRKHPEKLTGEDKFLTIDLHGIAAERVMEVLSRLIRDLESGTPVDMAGIKLEEMQQRFLTARARQGIGKIIAISLRTTEGASSCQ